MWTEGAGRARRSERARAMRWERGWVGSERDRELGWATSPRAGHGLDADPRTPHCPPVRYTPESDERRRNNSVGAMPCKMQIGRNAALRKSFTSVLSFFSLECIVRRTRTCSRPLSPPEDRGGPYPCRPRRTVAAASPVARTFTTILLARSSPRKTPLPGSSRVPHRRSNVLSESSSPRPWFVSRASQSWRGMWASGSSGELYSRGAHFARSPSPPLPPPPLFPSPPPILPTPQDAGLPPSPPSLLLAPVRCPRAAPQRRVSPSAGRPGPAPTTAAPAPTTEVSAPFEPSPPAPALPDSPTRQRHQTRRPFRRPRCAPSWTSSSRPRRPSPPRSSCRRLCGPRQDAGRGVRDGAARGRLQARAGPE